MDELKDEEFVELATEKGKIVSALNHFDAALRALVIEEDKEKMKRRVSE